jgi:hypothetical protein
MAQPAAQVEEGRYQKASSATPCSSRPLGRRLIRPVEAREQVLQHLRVDGCVVGELRPNGLELGVLLEAPDRHLTALVGGDALLWGRVGELAAQQQHTLQLPLLLRRRIELALVGLAAYGLVAPTGVCQPEYSNRAVSSR